jgi:hypothetical protein
MAHQPIRRKEPEPRPKIWSTGGQRPPFQFGAFGRASLFIAREGLAPVLAWSARTCRRIAVNVKNGAGRIPARKLGRLARFVPSHLRVAAWIKNLAATLAHASATVDPEVARGNDLVAEIEPHLWPGSDLPANPAPPVAVPDTPDADTETVAPVVLAEPAPVEVDPLASIREDIQDGPRAAEDKAPEPSGPPPPPGPMAEGAIQVLGYALGWGLTVPALIYGGARALWLYISGRDLRGIGQED